MLEKHDQDFRNFIKDKNAMKKFKELPRQIVLEQKYTLIIQKQVLL
jgi:hypothetical protein